MVIPVKKSQFSVDDKLKRAVHYYQSGELQKAEEVCEKILTTDPSHSGALHVLGLIAHHNGRNDIAADLINRALQNSPGKPVYWISLGNIFEEEGRLNQAISCYQKAVRLKPELGGVHYNMGNLFKQQGRLDEAISSYEEALRFEPDLVEAHYNMGNVSQEQGKFDEAISCYQKAVQLRPDFAEAYNNLGNAFQANAEPDKALSCYQKAVQLKPDSAHFYYNVANAFQRQGKFDKAISCYQAALRLKPDVAEVHYDMGNAFHGQGEFQGAIRSFRRAVRLRPNYPEAYNNMGNAFQADGDLDEAIACYQKALRLKPELTEALSNMGDALQEQGRCGEAIACYEQALALKPNSGIEVKRFFALPVICESRESIRRYRKGILDNIVSSRGKSISLENPSKQVGSTSFYLPYHGLNDKEMQEQIASFYIRTCPDLVWSTSGWNSKERREGTKIHIGIISKFLFNHTVGKLNLGIVENLSRVKFHVKLFQFPGKEDELSKAFRKAADEVVVLPSELKTAREEIAGQSLDILFYLDIGMEPLTYFLAFSRLAPVQCVTWGHPVSTGIPNMDYFISSEKAEPVGAEEHYSERLVCLQRLGIYYHRLELSEEPSSREKFGLPRGQTLYVCPQSLFKFHPDFDHILGAILRQDPNGLLVLIEGKHKNWTKLLRDRFARAFSDDVDRVRFQSRMPEKDFLSFLMVADAVLDTPHFGGGNTTLESLACGVPVVTWPGVFMRGRLTLALYKQLGVMDCVASSAESFVNIALRLANDKTWREEIKGKITTRVDVLYEDIEAVRELECFFEQAVKEAHKKNWAS